MLAGQVALITGSGRGIGKAIALRLARAGAVLAVLDVHREHAEATAREVLSGQIERGRADEDTAGGRPHAVRRRLEPHARPSLQVSTVRHGATAFRPVASLPLMPLMPLGALVFGRRELPHSPAGIHAPGSLVRPMQVRRWAAREPPGIGACLHARRGLHRVHGSLREHAAS